MGRDPVELAQHAPQPFRLLFLTLAAFFLRMFQVQAFGFWIDEALTPLRASASIRQILQNATVIQDAVSRDTHPPLYYLLIHVTQALTGDSDLALRWPSVLLGTLLVPLVYQLGRRVFGRSAGVWAALFTAISPLQIWYGQEARMYTLLMVTSAATLYFLWPMMKKRAITSQLPFYVVCLMLTSATHISAVFWVAGQALLLGWIIWPEWWGRRLIMIGGAAAFGGLLTLPWTVPRLFWGAEAGYTYLPPWVMVSDLFTGFGLGITPPKAAWLTNSLWVVLIWGTAAVLWWLWRTQKRRTLAFIVINLASAIVGIALVSPLKPLYQGVRHIMIGYPAWVILLGFLAACGWGRRPPGQRPPRWLGWSGLAVALVLVIGAAGSYSRMRSDPAVGKDHFREAIAYVEEEAAAGDLVLYNDAIAMLLHWHYAERDDLIVTALPTYPHRATNDMGNTLTALLQETERVWFFPGLPSDGRDDERLVRTWLNDNLPLLLITPFFSRGTELQVALYDGRLPAIPSSVQPVAWSSEGWPALQGVEVLAFDGRNGWVDLVWDRFDAASGREVKLSLIDPAGREWAAVQQPIAPTLPTDEGDITRRMYRLPLPEGLPPGPYVLTGQFIASGTTVTPSPVELQRLTYGGTVSQDKPLAVFDELELIAVDIVALEIRPGYAIPIAPIWRTPKNDFRPGDYEITLMVRDPAGRAVFEVQKAVGPERLSMWPAETLIRDPIGIQIPVNGPAGRYTLHWQVADSDGATIGADGFFMFESNEIQEGALVVEAWPLVDQMPPAAVNRTAAWGEFAQLRGYTVEVENEHLQVELVWESAALVEQNLHVFVHLVDAQSGAIVTQQDWVPAEGVRPTSGWRPGEFVIDPHLLSLTDVPPGRYHIVIGMYDPRTLERPLVVENGVESPNRQLILQEIVWP